MLNNDVFNFKPLTFILLLIQYVTNKEAIFLQPNDKMTRHLVIGRKVIDKITHHLVDDRQEKDNTL